MNKFFFGILVIFVFGTSCKKDAPKIEQEPLPQLVLLQGNISIDSTLIPKNRYILSGKVYIKNGAVLTIPAGTVIEVENKVNSEEKSALIITKGSKLNVNGTADNPVVFTSSSEIKLPGDWIGIIILGNAPTNQKNAYAKGLSKIPDHQFGGADISDNSGNLSYLRVEYAGGLNPSQEEEWEWDMVSGLSFNGVGNKTSVDHIMVTKSKDDGFQFVGGTVNAKYLIASENGDDNFDFDRGYTGNLQFLIAYHKTYSKFAIRSNGMESLNDKDASNNTPFTRPVISNFTVVGPENTDLANQSQGIYIRKNTRFAILNSIIAGYSEGALMMCSKTKPILLNNEGSLFINNLTNSDLLANTFMYDNGPTGNDIHPDNQVKNFAVQTGNSIEKPSINRNLLIENISDLDFNSIYSSNPDFSLKQGAKALSDADFNYPDLQNFFTKVSFRGAVGNDNWTKVNWAKW